MEIDHLSLPYRFTNRTETILKIKKFKILNFVCLVLRVEKPVILVRSDLVLSD